MNLDLSIIIACYNCEDTLERCLDSIPKDVGIEIILVNDNSSDQTQTVLEKYINRHRNETIISVLNKENLGAGRARNIGIKKATKTYITFLDSDDEFSGDLSNYIYNRMVDGYDCIVFDALHIKQKKKTYLKMFFTEDLHEGIIKQKDALVFIRGGTWGKIYKKDIVIDNDVFFGSIKRNEDMIFTKIAVANCKNIYYIEHPLYHYIYNENSLTQNKLLLDEENSFVAIEAIKKVLLSKGFSEEFNSIYFFECLYSVTMALIKLGRNNRECKTCFDKMARGYNPEDKYRKRYSISFRIAYKLFSWGIYDLFRNILRR